VLSLLVLTEPIFAWRGEEGEAGELFETLDLQPMRETREQEKNFYLNRP
jgi:hypothetical protein